MSLAAISAFHYSVVIPTAQFLMYVGQINVCMF